MTAERDPYRVLGLSSAASQAEITSAYRRLLAGRSTSARLEGFSTISSCLTMLEMPSFIYDR